MSRILRLRRRLDWAKQVRGLLRRELKSAAGRRVPLPTRLGLLRRGFLSESQVLYQLEKNRIDDYVSDTFRWLVSPFIVGAPYILDDKFVFTMTMEALGFPTPRLLAMYGGDGRLVTPAQTHTAATLLAWVERSGTLVFKPRFGGGGIGLIFAQVKDGVLHLNGAPASPGELMNRLGRYHYVAGEFVEQHPYAAAIAPGCTNTLRVLTMVQPSTGVPFIARAVHRFGTRATAPVDNFSRGGLSFAVEIESGTLGSGAPFPKEGRVTYQDTHPESGVRVRGTEIPHWPAIKEALLRLAARLPADVPYVGWDVVVTPDGYRILEGNRYSDVNVLQLHGPMLPDPRIREFYEHHAAKIGMGWPNKRR
jgi:hypothetical protein